MPLTKVAEGGRVASIRRAQAIVAKYKRPGVEEVEEFLRAKRVEAQRE